MKKKLIEYIGDMEQVNYADVSDFLKDIKDNSPERQVQILVNVLLNVEQQENSQKAKEGDLHLLDNKQEIFGKAMEEASKVLGADPAYFGKEGEEEVERQLKKMGYSIERLKEN